ncbi:MAG: hypothetical protein JRN09_03980 [Nitrososphaerota archaeon]|nr:hypothetical protein [Nitrososphaerota archaeon]
MKTIEAPSEEMAKELQAHLLEKKLRSPVYPGTGTTIEFPENMNAAQWLGVAGVVEKWAKGRQLDVVQSLRVVRPQATQPHDAGPADAEKTARLEADAKKRVEVLSPEEAEERYSYLSSKPLTELTEEESQERLLLAQRTYGKTKDGK